MRALIVPEYEVAPESVNVLFGYGVVGKSAQAGKAVCERVLPIGNTITIVVGGVVEAVAVSSNVCLPPALEDGAYLDWYVGEVLTARAEFEAALDQKKIRRWPSHANFILADIGSRHAEFVQHMRAADVLVRDRSNDPGCDGCVRITIGTRQQMRLAATALHETLAAMQIGTQTR